MFRVIKRVSIYLFSMPVSLAQWRGEIGAFYNNTLTFSKISIFYLLLSLSYGSIFCRLDLIKLSLLIISLILNGIIFFHFKKCRKINRKIGVYLFTTIYLLIISNLLEYLWVGSRIISLSGDIEINPGPKLNAINRCFSICHLNLNRISAHIFTKVSLQSAFLVLRCFPQETCSSRHLQNNDVEHCSAYQSMYLKFVSNYLQVFPWFPVDKIVQISPSEHLLV